MKIYSGLKLTETKLISKTIYILPQFTTVQLTQHIEQNNKNDIFNQLQDKIATFSATDKLIIGGDFNARTAILP